MRVASIALVVGLAGCSKTFGLAAPQPFDAPPPDGLRVFSTNFAFVTSTEHMMTEVRGDLSGADAICAARAVEAGLGGTYVAYLAAPTTGTTADGRLQNMRGWSRVDGKPFADRISDLSTGTTYYPLRLDETGADVGPTAQAATGIGMDCNDYASDSSTLMVTVGYPYFTESAWQYAGNALCTTTEHLYCLGVTSNHPLVVVPTPGRKAFVTVQAFTPGGGLAAADALCAGEAQAAGLSGTFLALLATTNTAPISRFSMAGPPWVRTDGIQIAASNLAFADGNWDTSLAVHADKSHALTQVFTGSITPAMPPPNASSTCADWTATSASGAVGLSYASGPSGSYAGPVTCGGAPVYCLEQ